MSSVSSARVRTDLPVVQEGLQLESDRSSTRSRSAVPRRAILPSISAPEHNIRALLDECVSNGAPATFSMVTGLWSVHIYRSDLDTARSNYHER